MGRSSSKNQAPEELEKVSSKKQPSLGLGLLHSIDESPEFHDPYSELNLFLSQKIKQEMRHCSNSKKWSMQLQDELLHKITPDFQKQFPKYRLGISALKKTWEKVHYFSTQIQEQKEALTQEGKLNIPFFIKENLKSTEKLRNTCHLHPYHYAHQLAVKMSECIAVVDGVRPKLDQLTRTIWVLQRHLIPELDPEHFKSPYDENEKIDKLIVKIILEITAKYPQISQAELDYYTQKKLHQLKTITLDYSPLEIKKMLTALFTDQTHFISERMEKTLEDIPYPVAKYLKNELGTILIDAPELSSEQVIQETAAFFQKAASALQPLEEEELKRKIQVWTIQGDMLIRWIRLNPHSSLLQEIKLFWKEKKEIDLHRFVSEMHKKLMEKHPHLIPFASLAEKRIWTFLKYIWYTEAFKEEVPTFDRFLQWHKYYLHLANTQSVEILEKLCKKMVPLMPFDSMRTQQSLVIKEKNHP